MTELADPGRFRAQVRIAKRYLLVQEHRGTDEVREIQLCDLPFQEQLGLPSLRRDMGHHTSRFEKGETALKVRIPALGQCGMLETKAVIQGNITRRPGIMGQEIPADLLDADIAAGYIDNYRARPGILGKDLLIIQNVQGPLEVDLQGVIGEARPVKLHSRD